jgi:hypothetical protein
MADLTVGAQYTPPTTNKTSKQTDWRFSGSINGSNEILVPPGISTITFNLDSPTGAVFTDKPLDWPKGQPSISDLTGGGTNSISFTDNNSGASKEVYMVKLNIKLADGTFVTSTDPTIINEETGPDKHH